MQMLRQHDINRWDILESSTKCTPDWEELKSGYRDEFPVFIVGSMRNRNYLSQRLDGCNYYGPAYTYNNDFVMRVPNFCNEVRGFHPIVFSFEGADKNKWFKEYSDFNENDLKHVDGELYGVPLRKLSEIDRFEKNTQGVTRETTWVKLMSPIQENALAKAFIYTVDHDIFLDQQTPTRSCSVITFKHDDKNVESYYF